MNWVSALVTVFVVKFLILLSTVSGCELSREDVMAWSLAYWKCSFKPAEILSMNYVFNGEYFMIFIFSLPLRVFREKKERNTNNSWNKKKKRALKTMPLAS